MTYVHIAGEKIPAALTGSMRDTKWGYRRSETVRFSAVYAEAADLLTDDAEWYVTEEYTDENGETYVIATYDKRDFCIRGDVTYHHNGDVSVKMGALTDADINAILTGGFDV